MLERRILTANKAHNVQVQNSRRRTANRLALGTTDQVIVVCKTVPGHGAGLAGHIIVAGDVEHVAVGDPVPGCPGTFSEMNGLTHQQLSALSAAYNDDFGVVTGDNLSTRREKFRNFVCM